MRGRRSGWSRSWRAGASAAVALGLLALSIIACGPEDTRSRDGGTGGSSRPDAPATGTGAPELRTVPTANTPYTSETALPPLPTRAAAPGGTPATPGFGVPTTTAPAITVTPGASPGTPTR